MGNLYLVDKHAGENSLALAEIDPDAVVVLIQDGVYLWPRACALGGPKKVYAVRPDVEKRGLTDSLAGHVETVGYNELVDLIVEHKVVNFA